LIGSPCSFGLTYHRLYYFYIVEYDDIGNHLLPKTPPRRLLTNILAPCCPNFFFISSTFLLCSKSFLYYIRCTCRTRTS
jgi:hypothetical protein